MHLQANFKSLAGFNPLMCGLFMKLLHDTVTGFLKYEQILERMRKYEITIFLQCQVKETHVFQNILFVSKLCKSSL